MTRNSDLWIVVALAAWVGWRTWQRWERQSEVQATPTADVTTSVDSVDSIVTESTPSRVGRSALPSPTVYPAFFHVGPNDPTSDCSQAPPGSVIFHDVGGQARCMPPVVGWGY